MSLDRGEAPIEAADLTLLVIAKQPLAGRAKTRLAPALGDEGAAELAEAALADSLEAVAATPARRHVIVLEGEPGEWLPGGFEIVAQRGDGLAERLANGFSDTGDPALLVGMDTPQITPGLLATAGEQLCVGGTDAVLGLAEDGGWWAIGLTRAEPAVFEGVPMSTAETGAAQRAALERRGLRTTELPTLRDVDTLEDAIAVAELAPDGRFAATLERLHATAPAPAVAPAPVRSAG